MAVKLSQIEKYLENKHIAVIGASSDAKAFSNIIISELNAKGYAAYPVNPKGGMIANMRVYLNISEVPSQAKAAYIITNPKQTDQALESAINAGYKHIWVHNSCDTKSVTEFSKPDINLIFGQCLVMYLSNTGVHRFHKFILKLFNKLPK